MPAIILYAYNPVTLNNYITCFLLGGDEVPLIGK